MVECLSSTHWALGPILRTANSSYLVLGLRWPVNSICPSRQSLGAHTETWKLINLLCQSMRHPPLTIYKNQLYDILFKAQCLYFTFCFMGVTGPCRGTALYSPMPLTGQVRRRKGLARETEAGETLAVPWYFHWFWGPSRAVFSLLSILTDSWPLQVLLPWGNCGWQLMP